MSERIRRLLDDLGIYALWAVLAGILALTAFQVYTALLFLGMRVVETPSIRPSGWNTATITGLSKFLILLLGMLWLLAVSMLERWLREGLEERQLRARVLRLVLAIGAVFGVSYGVLLAF